MPPPECRLRDADILGNSWVLIVVQGMFQVAAALQTPPVMTSGALALGRLKPVNPVALPHQMKPRRSPPWPWISSAAMRVLEVPSEICWTPAAGCPALPHCWNWTSLSLSGWAHPYVDCIFVSVNHPAG